MVIKNPALIRHRYGRYVVYAALSIFLVLYLFNHRFSFSASNGFDFEDALIPPDEIFHGGPPRDGIPAIDDPKFVSAKGATFLSNADRVLGIVHQGLVKAYPVSILNYHEIVNDMFKDEPVVISYCPLCGSGIAFSATVAGKATSFGVSGLLYNSDMLLYDRQTESLWSQILGKAISGPLKGQALTRIVMANTTWGDWRRQHADTLVLSTDTGYSRDYTRGPYGDYDKSTAIYFPVHNKNNQYHPKEMVIGLEMAGQYKAYPFTELAKNDAVITDTLAGQQIRIEFDAANRTGRVLTKTGKEIPSTLLYWFAWSAFHPDTAVYKKRL